VQLSQNNYSIKRPFSKKSACTHNVISTQQPVTVRNTVEKSTVTCFNKKLSYCRETARFFVTLNTSLSHSRSLKIIQNDTLEQGMCKSLLVFHCNYVCTLYRFWDIQRHIMAWPWNLGWESFKVIENGTIRKLGYFLFAFHSNYGFILYHFWDKVRYWSKITIFSYPSCIRWPHWGVPIGILPYHLV